MADNGMTVTAVLAGLGVVGYIISVIFAYRLLKDMKKGKRAVQLTMARSPASGVKAQAVGGKHI